MYSVRLAALANASVRLAALAGLPPRHWNPPSLDCRCCSPPSLDCREALKPAVAGLLLLQPAVTWLPPRHWNPPSLDCRCCRPPSLVCRCGIETRCRWTLKPIAIQNDYWKNCGKIIPKQKQTTKLTNSIQAALKPTHIEHHKKRTPKQHSRNGSGPAVAEMLLCAVARCRCGNLMVAV